MNLFYLHHLDSNYKTISAEEQAELLEIATQCYDYGGEAVFTARNLYHTLVGGYKFDDNAACVELREQAAKMQKSTARILLIPNPAKDRIQILVPDAAVDALLQVNIGDASGKLIRQITCSNGDLLFLQLPGGVYYCKVQGPDNLLQTVKLVIIP